MKKNKKNGKEAFDAYYEKIFNERWQTLRESLFIEKQYFSFQYDNCETYFLDPASVLAASMLPLEDTKNILDMCAAPGGKTLILASRMEADAHLFSNERSADRRNRLVNVVKTSLPFEISERIQILAQDGALMCRNENNQFDAILLDAPCSSEQHVIAAEKYLEQWTEARIKNLSFTQWSLLSSAFLMLKENGYLVYSTCALSPTENDGVVKKLLKKYSNAQNVDVDFSKVSNDLIENFKLSPEKTAYGYQVFPDSSSGAGPIYFSLIRKMKS